MAEQLYSTSPIPAAHDPEEHLDKLLLTQPSVFETLVQNIRDTFNPPKVLLNFRMDKLPPEEWVGLCDFPSIWNQRQREERGMSLHWVTMSS